MTDVLEAPVAQMKKSQAQPDENGYYGEFGGAYIPEMLYHNVENLRKNYLKITKSKSFQKEYQQLLRDFVGRPTPLYFAERLSQHFGAKIYLSVKICVTQAHTRSITPLDRFCSRNVWAKNA